MLCVMCCVLCPLCSLCCGGLYGAFCVIVVCCMFYAVRYVVLCSVVLRRVLCVNALWRALSVVLCSAVLCCVPFFYVYFFCMLSVVLCRPALCIMTSGVIFCDVVLC